VPVYDFDGDSGAERVPRPHALLTAAEFGRAGVEYTWSWLLDAALRNRSDGAGRPVLVLPGFYANDALTRRVRSHLQAYGFRPYGWGLGRNFGLTDTILDGAVARFDEVHAQDGQPISLVGWSFGGLLARWLAHERPDAVRQVVCLGSPWRAEGERTRTTAMFERSATKHGLSERARDIVAALREPLPVMTTAIYSRTDGIVHWRGCALDVDGTGAPSENIAVPSSHIGLVANPLALAALTDRLLQDPTSPVAFDWRRCLRGAVLGNAA
jgi:pimeloyl-ACP methyl ester carboxylesterase